MLKEHENLILKFEQYLKGQPLIESGPTSFQKLFESMNYSLDSGGKRFRPVLSLLTAKTLNQSLELVLPVALAVEMIHTYSLIHDDLPVMDNDDLRRGRPTNHKIYGEPLALLAGDALQAEAFRHLATSYKGSPETGLNIIELIAEASGARGMVGGQVVDIDPSEEMKKEWISFIHENKTGALIRVSVEAAAVACGINKDIQLQLREFGAQLGFAFQLADDILDWDEKNPETTSYVSVYGIEKTKQKLTEISKNCLLALKSAHLPIKEFEPLVIFNQERQK
ncbi:MAG: polyprenyl synthetase family protein [Bdellovibrionales bacterium]|nr:polyprenyl synthetase family protein [Bdellovibrionales bacterium]